MYPTVAVPSSSTTTTSGASHASVSSDGAFWRIQIWDGATRLLARDADEIRLVRADGVILQLGAAGANDSWWSRNADGTSNPTGAQAGDHTLYHRCRRRGRG